MNYQIMTQEIDFNEKKKNEFRYKEKTEENEELLRAASTDSDDAERVWKIINEQTIKAIFASFGKVTIKIKRTKKNNLNCYNRRK